MHYYSHNINDFNNATLHLTVEEECMYHRALAWYYTNEKPLPADLAKTYRYLRATTKKLQSAVNNILEDFFDLQDDGYHQSRCDAEIAAFHSKSELARNNGAKGGRPSKADTNQSETQQEPNKNQNETQKKPNDNPNKTQTKPNQEPLTNNQEPETKVLKTLSGDDEKPDQNQTQNQNETQQQTKTEPDANPAGPVFTDFWDLYDKKNDRPKCEKRWNNLTRKDQQAIMIALPAYIAATPDKQYRKDPATYLNNRAWENEITQPTAQQPMTTRQAAPVPPLFGSNKTRAFGGQAMRDVTSTLPAIEHQEITHV